MRIKKRFRVTPAKKTTKSQIKESEMEISDKAEYTSIFGFVACSLFPKKEKEDESDDK